MSFDDDDLVFITFESKSCRKTRTIFSVKYETSHMVKNSQSKAVEKTMPRYWYNILFVASSACKKRDATFEVKDITRVWRYHHISKFYCARYKKTRKATSYRSARKLLLDKSGNIKMPNGFSGKKTFKKGPKTKQWPSPSNFTYSK